MGNAKGRKRPNGNGVHVLRREDGATVFAPAAHISRCPGARMRQRKSDGATFAVACQQWGCGVCGPRKASALQQRTARELIRAFNRGDEVRLVTLTYATMAHRVDPSTGAMEPAVAYSHVQETLGRWRAGARKLAKQLGRPVPRLRYLAVLEFGSAGRRAQWHLICVTDQPTSRAWWATDGLLGRAWRRGFVHARRAEPTGFVRDPSGDAGRLASYLCKYLNKELNAGVKGDALRQEVSRGTLKRRVWASTGWGAPPTPAQRAAEILLLGQRAGDFTPAARFCAAVAGGLKPGWAYTSDGDDMTTPIEG